MRFCFLCYRGFRFFCTQTTDEVELGRGCHWMWEIFVKIQRGLFCSLMRKQHSLQMHSLEQEPLGANTPVGWHPGCGDGCLEHPLHLHRTPWLVSLLSLVHFSLRWFLGPKVFWGTPKICFLCLDPSELQFLFFSFLLFHSINVKILAYLPGFTEVLLIHLSIFKQFE